MGEGPQFGHVDNTWKDEGNSSLHNGLGTEAKGSRIAFK
jgi:hypothetical protein